MSDKKVTYSTHHGVFQGDTLDEAIELANEMATHIEKAKDTAVRYRVAVSERQPSEQARVEPGELGTCPIHGGGQTADAQRAIEAFENGSLRPDVLDEAAELRARAEKARVRGSRIAARTGRADYQEGKADGLDEAASLVESVARVEWRVAWKAGNHSTARATRNEAQVIADNHPEKVSHIEYRTVSEWIHGFDFPMSAERGCDASAKEGARDTFGSAAREPASSLVESSQEALVKLAERLEAQAKMATQSVTYWEKRGADIRAQDESRLATLLREAASTLTTYEQALGAVRTVLFDWVGKQERSMPRTRDEWGPVCAGCGADEYRIDGFCSGECRDRYQFGLEIRAALEGSKQ